MPIITAFVDHPTRPYVRVEINWADTPAVQHAGVSRVDVATGECTPLRPYVCYSGWELLLSCGHGTFWDTEAPFGTEFYYITQSEQAPCVPATPLVLDTYSRVLVDSWGSPDIGPPYTLNGGTNPGNYDVDGTAGTQTNDSVNVLRHSIIDVGSVDQDIYAQVSLPVATASGANIAQNVAARFTDTSNYYFASLSLTTAGAVTIALGKRVGGALMGVGTSTVTIASSHTVGEIWNIHLQVAASGLSVTAWLTGVEPEEWQLLATDTSLTTGTNVALFSRLEAGNTNGTVVVSWHDLRVQAPCVPCEPVTVDTSATPTTLVNDGRFWLKDPVRPCNDRPVPLCQTGSPLLPGCGGDGGILFVGIGPEIYASNSFSLRPMNRRRTIAVTRPRGDATTALRLQTLTFTDRDELLQLVIPGTPLLFQGPSEYGIPDRYMGIRDVQISPELSDLRIQIRSAVLPYDTVDRPAGPSQGICGTRVADICALYPTWDDLAAAGFTWDDLIRGAASPESANPDRRTWDDVNAEFVDWDAVEAGGRTWTGLLEGD